MQTDNKKCPPCIRFDAEFEKILFWSCAFGFIVVAILAGFVATHFFPITDGWYETMVWLEHHGRIVYKDLDFPLPPVTVWFYHLLHAIVGENIATGRIIGVGLSVLNACLAYAWIARRGSAASAAAGAFVLLVIETTGGVYIARDYHTLVTLFTLLTLYPAMLFPSKQRSQIIGSLLTGAAIWLLFLTKQNVGVMVGLAVLTSCLSFCFPFLWLTTDRAKDAFLAFVSVLAGLAIAVGITAIAQPSGMSLPDIIEQVLSIKSKGSVIYIMMRVIHDAANVRMLVASGALLLIVLAITIAARQISDATKDEQPLSPRAKKLCSLAASLGLLLIMVACVVPFRGTWATPDAIAIFAVAAYMVDMFLVISARLNGNSISKEAIMRLAIFTALIFANMMTASINLVGVGLLAVFYFAELCNKLIELAPSMQKGLRQTVLGSVIICLMLFSVRFEIHKVLQPYAWWGIEESGVQFSDTHVDLPPLYGLSIPMLRAEMIESIVKRIDAVTTENDPIFATLNIPIFYLLANRKPTTRTFIQWFDVAREESLIEDYRKLSSNPPKAIIELVTPQFVYDGHVGLIGRSLLQRDFANYLNCMIAAGGLTEHAFWLYNASDTHHAIIRVGADPALTGRQIFDLGISEEARRHGVIFSVPTGNEEHAFIKSNDIIRMGLQDAVFTQIIVSGMPKNIEMAVSKLNSGGKYHLNLAFDNFVLRLLERGKIDAPAAKECRNQLERVLSNVAANN